MCALHAQSGSCRPESSCCIEAIIVFRSPLPRTAPWISADVLANHNQNCFSYNWNAMGDPRPAERMGTARTVNRRCQSGLWEGSSADSSSRFLTNAKDGLKKSLLAGLTIQVVRYACFPSPYYSSPRNLLLHHFTRQDLRSARSVSPVNSYDSRSTASAD